MSKAAVYPGGATPERAGWVRWGASFIAVVALHGGLAAFLAARRLPPPSESNEGPAIVMIDLAPPPSAPADPPSEAPPSEAAPEAAAPESVPDETPPPTAEPDPSPPPPEAVPPEPVPPEPAPPEPAPPEPIPEPVPVPVPPKAEVVLPIAPPKVRSPPVPKPVAIPKIAPRKPAKPVEAVKRAPPREARRPPAQASGAPSSASAPSVASAASAASAASWRSQLVAYLQRNLRYPPGSHGGGVASISFSMNRQGRVLSTSLARSAGAPDLDAAALDLFRRAQPLPAPPTDVPGGNFSFTIPIRFNAR